MKFLDKSFENENCAELAAAPVSALPGVSGSDGQHLEEAFGMGTIS